MSVFIHETAIVDAGAEIGEGSRVWHFSHVSSGARLGSNVSLGQNVYVGDVVKVGDNCKVQNNVSIYDNVVLDDGVFCGPSVVFTNVINPRALVDRRSEYLKTTVQLGATLGANCTIVCGVTIGKYAFIAAGAVVTSSVKDFALIMGVPGKHVGWMSAAGERIPLPVSGDGSFTCPTTNEIYELTGGNLRLIQ